MLYLFCLFFGAIGPVNNMLNVKAGQCLGTARGALINYAEATILSTLLIFLMGLGQELAWSHIASVPPIYYCGSVFGLLAMGLIITATPKTGVVLCSICLMIGSMTTSAILDYVFYDLFSWRKVVGILLIMAGIITKQMDSARQV